MNKLQKRGRQVYRLVSVIQWAAFKFLAATTAIFIWVSFHAYFLAKLGATGAAIMGAVSVLVMFGLIDKGLDKLIEFLADERMNPTKSEETANPKARTWFFRIVVFLALVRLLATGTTSLWGSFEIADYVTEKPDETRITEAMESETATLDKSRTSLENQLAQARKTEAGRVKQAKAQGHAIVEASLTHPNPDVTSGFRTRQGWYWTTPKLRKYRDAYKKALADSTALVASEMSKAAELESALTQLNTAGLSKAQEVRDKLAAVAVQEVRGYEAKKSRRTNFLIIADFIAVVFGIIAVWIRATYRAAVGVESELEEKTLEGVVSAALSKWGRAFVNWVEKVMGVDLDGDGKVGGGASLAVPAPVPKLGTTGTGVPSPAPHPGIVPVSNTRTTVVRQQSRRVLVETSNLKRLARQQWERAFTSKDKETRERNRAKALENQRELEALGYEVIRRVEDDSDSPTGKIGKMEIRIPEND